MTIVGKLEKLSFIVMEKSVNVALFYKATILFHWVAQNTYD